MISRNHKSLIWQYINWEKVIKYIDSLKSRKYKAYVQKSFVINYNTHKFFINSPIVILLAFKSGVNSLDIELNTFELGYLLFCLINILYLDMSFFYYYKNVRDINLGKAVRYLVSKVHYLVVIWSLENYANYLRYICHLSYRQFSKVNSILDTVRHESTKYKYALLFDFKYCISYFSLLTLLNKVYVDKNTIKFLLNFFTLGYFNHLVRYLNIRSNFFFTVKNKLFKKLLDLFVLQICYELSIVLSQSFCIKYSVTKIDCISDSNWLLVLCQDNYQLRNLRKKMLSLLLFNGVTVKPNERKEYQYMAQGISTRLLSIYIKYRSYPFYFAIKPSLHSQFILMQQVSLILYQSKSISLFLLNIRLNMLIMLWSSIYFEHSVNKIFYLLDYLIALRLRYFGKYYKYFFVSTIKFSKKTLKNQKLSYSLKKNYVHIFTNIYSKEYYKYYFLVRLFWLYNLKCKTSLREAV